MAQILSTITCDLGRGSCTPSSVRVMQYDSDIRYIAVKFLDKGQAWNVPVGYAVKLRMMKSDGTPTCKPVDNVTGNTAQFQVTADMCKNGGSQKFTIEVASGDGEAIYAFPMRLSVTRNPVPEDMVPLGGETDDEGGGSIPGGGGTGQDGEDGATFIPSVSENGIISWTNDKGLPNPEPVNIKGPKGDDGDAGPQGSPGQDGYSPTVQVEDIAGGSRITITDEDGPHIFEIMDGLDGGEAATPEIGANGNWYIGGVDTGKPSRGEQGPQGEQGPPGQGIPVGGTTDQVLKKKSDADYDVEWGNVEYVTTKESPNIFDKSIAEFGKSFYHSSSGPQEMDDANGFICFVKLKGPGIYRTVVNETFHGLDYAKRIPILKEDKTFLQNVVGTLGEIVEGVTVPIEFEVTQEMVSRGAALYAFDGYAPAIDTIMIVKDIPYPDIYYPYGEIQVDPTAAKLDNFLWGQIYNVSAKAKKNKKSDSKERIL